MLGEKQKNIFEKVKNIFLKEDEKNNKKKIENLVTLIIILIVTVIAINSIWNSDKKEKVNINSEKTLADISNNINGNISDENIQNNENLEDRLENILETIDGVGKVKVLLTYSQSSTTVAMYNEDSTKSDTEESDSRRWE